MALFQLLVFLQIVGYIVSTPVDDQTDWRKWARDDIKETLKVKVIDKPAKNVILFVGDGMGFPTIAAGRILKGQRPPNDKEKAEETYFSFEKFPDSAIIRTYSADRQVTASAEAATAYQCGIKANGGTIGVNANAVRGQCSTQAGTEVTCLSQWSLKEGKAVGIVTTTRITHASPAPLFAQSAERYWETYNEKYFNETQGQCMDIGLQLMSKSPGLDIAVLMGGGRRHLTTVSDVDPEYSNKKGSRLDGRNLIDEWKADKAGKDLKHKYVWNKAQFEEADTENMDALLGLFEPNHMRYDLDRRDNEDGAGEPSLAEMTATAIKILKKNPKGYYLFVEGGRIDHGHHDNLGRQALEDMIAMDDAVKVAADNTDEKDTLIVVTGDHSDSFIMGGYPTRGNDILGFVNTDVEPVLDGVGPFTTLMYTNGPSANFSRAGRRNLTNIDPTDKHFVQDSQVYMKYETHSGEDIPIYARGPMSHLFRNVHENSYIAHALAYASCVGDGGNRCDDEPAGASGLLSSSIVMPITLAAILIMSLFI